jgi:glycosyltransferase involved in cell wall biosynthesis
VTATTNWLADLLRSRVARLPSVHVVRNGFDASDFPPVPPVASPAGAPLRLVHTGMLTLTRSAAGLLHGLQRLHERDPGLRTAFEIEMIGGRESRNDALATSLGLEHCVRLARTTCRIATRSQRCRAPTCWCSSSTVEARFRGLIPGKLYEYMGAGRPILALVPDSEAADLVRDLGWGEVAPPDDPEAIAAALARLLAHKRAGRLQDAYPRRGRERFERRTQASEIAAILTAIAPLRATTTEAP